jgi:class 3 adenylate cyclase
VADKPPPPDLESYALRAERQLESGSPLVAYDILAEGLVHFPGDVRLRQLTALALARSGASRPAAEILEALRREGHTDEETLGLLARTHKDLWAGSRDPAERRRRLQLAYRSYLEAYRKSRGFWSGINAATMALLLGQRDEATALAGSVRAECLDLLSGATAGNRYWLLATLGEAALIRGNWPEAEGRYLEAASIAGHRLGDLASTRRNAHLIARHLGSDPGRIERCFQMPRVAVLVGHLIDRAGRTPERFPSALEGAVREAIRERLGRLRVGFGYASAACGSDILFHELLLEMNAEAHVILPYDRDQFEADSVIVAPGSDWAARYRRILGAAKEVMTVSDQRLTEGGASYEYGLLMLDGTAAIRADELDTELVSIAVWDGRSGDGPGGTEAAVTRWRAAGRDVEVIDLAEMVSRGRPAPTLVAAVGDSTPPARPSEGAMTFTPEIVSLLFADARGFSRLSDAEIPSFVDHFLGAVAAEVERCPNPPIIKNTWGDGLYMVFASVKDAGEFALHLCDVLESTDWAAKGFSQALSLRIGLHAGPAYSCTDPVTGRLNYFGAHVSRAARIEPITPPGHVYASGAFAALARSQGVQEFSCAYVGQLPFAKGYGTFPTYHVYRARSLE